ncbi:MAG: hypothetical protein EOP88_07390 [Verrucomicrobiaceae bacterium]|nr:MAG: hypothetical protein EOP88_07390 [Verrucomicrobiaceae bacterium]
MGGLEILVIIASGGALLVLCGAGWIPKLAHSLGEFGKAKQELEDELFGSGPPSPPPVVAKGP